MNRRWIEVNDLMQRDYAYRLTARIGKDFHAEFRPELTPKQMLSLGIFGGKYMTDCAGGLRRLASQRQALSDRTRSRIELLRCQRVTTAIGLETTRLDLRGGSARVVPMVLPLFHGAPLPRR